MKPATKILLELIEILEERDWEYEIYRNKLFTIMLGNVLRKAYTYDENSLQDILDDVNAW